ncbi:MAG TPA: ribosome recycling factor, partial [Bacteroidales bacterium]|nr:ribosome recycling factor [Bacteroidales bacterium]
MNDDCILCLEETLETMQLAITHLERELHKIRAGKATPDMLEGVKIEYYGTVTPLNQVSNITTPDPKQIIVQPWDRSILGV